MQELLANGNYAPFLAQALSSPMPGAGYGMNPAIGQPFGPAGFGPGQFGQGQLGQGLFGQGQLGQSPFGQAGGLTQGFGQQLGQPHNAMQQQQVAATLHQLANYLMHRIQVGQQIAATLQHIAQHAVQQIGVGYQFAQVLNQLAHQCAWHAQQAQGGNLGMPMGVGQPFGHQSFGQPWGFNRAW